MNKEKETYDRLEELRRVVKERMYSMAKELRARFNDGIIPFSFFKEVYEDDKELIFESKEGEMIVYSLLMPKKKLEKLIDKETNMIWMEIGRLTAENLEIKESYLKNKNIVRGYYERIIRDNHLRIKGMTETGNFFYEFGDNNE